MTMRWMQAAILGVATTGLVGCQWVFSFDDTPAPVPEDDRRSCTDGRDNDRDGWTDARDPRCWPVLDVHAQSCATLPGESLRGSFDDDVAFDVDFGDFKPLGPRASFPRAPRGGRFRRLDPFADVQRSGVEFSRSISGATDGLDMRARMHIAPGARARVALVPVTLAALDAASGDALVGVELDAVAGHLRLDAFGDARADVGAFAAGWYDVVLRVRGAGEGALVEATATDEAGRARRVELRPSGVPPALTAATWLAVGGFERAVSGAENTLDRFVGFDELTLDMPAYDPCGRPQPFLADPACRAPLRARTAVDEGSALAVAHDASGDGCAVYTVADRQSGAVTRLVAVGSETGEFDDAARAANVTDVGAQETITGVGLAHSGTAWVLVYSVADGVATRYFVSRAPYCEFFSTTEIEVDAPPNAEVAGLEVLSDGANVGLWLAVPDATEVGRDLVLATPVAFDAYVAGPPVASLRDAVAPVTVTRSVRSTSRGESVVVFPHAQRDELLSLAIPMDGDVPGPVEDAPHPFFFATGSSGFDGSALRGGAVFWSEARDDSDPEGRVHLLLSGAGGLRLGTRDDGAARVVGIAAVAREPVARPVPASGCRAPFDTCWNAPERCGACEPAGPGLIDTFDRPADWTRRSRRLPSGAEPSDYLGYEDRGETYFLDADSTARLVFAGGNDGLWTRGVAPIEGDFVLEVDVRTFTEGSCTVYVGLGPATSPLELGPAGVFLGVSGGGSRTPVASIEVVGADGSMARSEQSATLPLEWGSWSRLRLRRRDGVLSLETVPEPECAGSAVEPVSLPASFSSPLSSVYAGPTRYLTDFGINDSCFFSGRVEIANMRVAAESGCAGEACSEGGSLVCRDTRSDRLACGACGVACEPGAVCEGGRCVVPPIRCEAADAIPADGSTLTVDVASGSRGRWPDDLAVFSDLRTPPDVVVLEWTAPRDGEARVSIDGDFPTRLFVYEGDCADGAGQDVDGYFTPSLWARAGTRYVLLLTYRDASDVEPIDIRIEMGEVGDPAAICPSVSSSGGVVGAGAVRAIGPVSCRGASGPGFAVAWTPTSADATTFTVGPSSAFDTQPYALAVVRGDPTAISDGDCALAGPDGRTSLTLSEIVPGATYWVVAIDPGLVSREPVIRVDPATIRDFEGFGTAESVDIADGDVVVATRSSAGDRDVFRIDVPPGALLELQEVDWPYDLDASIAVSASLPPDDAVGCDALREAGAAACARFPEGVLLVADGGPRYVIVDHGAEPRLSFRVRIIRPNEQEPNDLGSNARMVETEVPIWGTSSSADDVDVFRIPLRGANYLEFGLDCDAGELDASPPSSGLAYRLVARVEDLECATPPCFDSIVSCEQSINFTPEGDGDVYLELRPLEGFPTPEHYRLTVFQSSIVLDAEPNDTPETAQPLARGISLITRDGPDDLELFYVDVAAGERVAVDGLGQTTVSLHVIPPTGTSFDSCVAGASLDCRSDGAVSYTATAAGRVYVLAETDPSIERSFFRIDSPGIEPNDSPFLARPLTVGERVSLDFTGAGDRELFTLETQACAPIVLETLDCTTDTVLAVFASEPLVSWFGVDGARTAGAILVDDDSGADVCSRLRFLPSGASTYYVEVGSYGASETGRFDLAVSSE
jgi:hypothetical protein